MWANIWHFRLSKFLIDNDNSSWKKKLYVCLWIVSDTSKLDKQGRIIITTQHIDSLFSRAERLGNVFVMWLSGKLYELLPFDKHMQRQHPLCKCPVGRGIVLHISKLPRSRRTCREYEWDWSLSKPKASLRQWRHSLHWWQWTFLPISCRAVFHGWLFSGMEHIL